MNIKLLMAELPQDQRDSLMESFDLASRINRELLDGAGRDAAPADWFLHQMGEEKKYCELR